MPNNKPGSITFQAEASGEYSKDGVTIPLPGGDIIFKIGNVEHFRLANDGTFFVRGERAGYSQDIYKGFCDWLSKATHSHTQDLGPE